MINRIIAKTKSQAAKMGWFMPLVPIILMTGVTVILAVTAIEEESIKLLGLCAFFTFFILVYYYTY